MISWFHHHRFLLSLSTFVTITTLIFATIAITMTTGVLLIVVIIKMYDDWYVLKEQLKNETIRRTCQMSRNKKSTKSNCHCHEDMWPSLGVSKDLPGMLDFFRSMEGFSDLSDVLLVELLLCHFGEKFLETIICNCQGYKLFKISRIW